jgi:adenosylhomocysteine nucleosidase
MKTVGLIAAMSMESQALLRLVRDPKRIKVGRFKGYRFQLPQWECVLVECGWGMFRAEEATRTLIEEVHPALLLSFGIAGAVDEDLNIGDVVCAENHYLLQNGSLQKRKATSSLSLAAQKGIVKSLKIKSAHLYSGATVTTRGSQFIPKQRNALTHPVLEMETAGVVQAIMGTGIPLVSLRGISDGPKAPIPFDLEAMVDDNYHMDIGKVLWAILRRPAMLPQALKMSKNSQLAAENEALATLAALTLPNPVRVSH